MRTLKVLAAAALATLVFAVPAYAITNGTPDGNAHPQVGVVVAEVHGGRHYFCSGTLLSTTVFLLAEHCDVSFLQPTGLWVYSAHPARPEHHPGGGPARRDLLRRPGVQAERWREDRWPR